MRGSIRHLLNRGDPLAVLVEGRAFGSMPVQGTVEKAATGPPLLDSLREARNAEGGVDVVKSADGQVALLDTADRRHGDLGEVRKFDERGVPPLLGLLQHDRPVRAVSIAKAEPGPSREEIKKITGIDVDQVAAEVQRAMEHQARPQAEGQALAGAARDLITEAVAHRQGHRVSKAAVKKFDEVCKRLHRPHLAAKAQKSEVTKGEAPTLAEVEKSSGLGGEAARALRQRILAKQAERRGATR